MPDGLSFDSTGILQIEGFNACCNTQSGLYLYTHRLQGKRAITAAHQYICTSTNAECGFRAHTRISALQRARYIVAADHFSRAEYQPGKCRLTGNADIKAELSDDGIVSSPDRTVRRSENTPKSFLRRDDCAPATITAAGQYPCLQSRLCRTGRCHLGSHQRSQPKPAQSFEEDT